MIAFMNATEISEGSNKATLQELEQGKTIELL
jgi:hypothetical protein